MVLDDITISVLFGRARGGARAIVCVEAKAGEDFGPYVVARIESAIKGTNLPKRANHLAEGVFGRKAYDYDHRFKTLRYQLLHAIAGTAIEAATQKADLAAFAVHFFPSARKPIADSVTELTDFLREMTAGRIQAMPEGKLESVRLPGGGTIPRDFEVFVGWVQQPTTCPFFEALEGLERPLRTAYPSGGDASRAGAFGQRRTSAARRLSAARELPWSLGKEGA